jgi:odorant receptor
VDTWYPYDKYNKFWYNFTLVWQTMSSCWFICGLLGTNLIFYSLITLIVMQFNILSMRLEKLKPTDEEETFKELIENHEKLLELSRIVEDIFSPAILFNVVASSVLICLVGYQATLGTDSEEVVKFSAFLVAALLQILMLCRNGQKLISAADKLGDSIYSCDWYSDQRKMKTIMVMMMQRAQKPNALTAFNFSVLDLEAFTVVSVTNLQLEVNQFCFNFQQILSSSFSYFTLLKSING